MAAAQVQPESLPSSRRLECVARDFLALVEAVDRLPRRQWLERLARLLPDLHAAIAAADDGMGKCLSHPVPSDLDARFDLYTRLYRVLGEFDAYWLEFDVARDGQGMSGSLADDLTDIYFELRHGLDLMDGTERGTERCLRDWQAGYRLHWGQHLVDAERYLYSLQAAHRISC